LAGVEIRTAFTAPETFSKVAVVLEQNNRSLDDTSFGPVQPTA
jgi:hypothetical protein